MPNFGIDENIIMEYLKNVNHDGDRRHYSIPTANARSVLPRDIPRACQILEDQVKTAMSAEGAE